MAKKTKSYSALKKDLGTKLLFAAGIAAVLFFAVFAFVFKIGPFNPPCANSISCINDLSGNYQPQNEAIYLGQKINQPKYIASDIVKTSVLGDSTGTDKHIYVDLTNQRVYAFEGSKLIYNFLTSTGKWHPTPTGDFNIWIKLRYTRMSGGTGADYYDLPNVPYTMFFANDQVGRGQGFSLHGAYWHNNFGHPMSHGCVNLRPEDAALLYAWADPATTGNTTYATAANPGTEVTIYGAPPADQIAY